MKQTMVTITISGAPGSGTTTIAEILEKKLKLNYIYAGDLFRKMAKEKNLSLNLFGKYCEEHKEVDEKLDRYQKKVLQVGNVILEGRIAGWIAFRNKIAAFKVLLNADEKTRIERIIRRENGDFKEKKKEMLSREKSEAKRYRMYYNINIKDETIYDLVIDTSNKKPQEIVELIIRKMKDKYILYSSLVLALQKNEQKKE